MSMKSVYFAGRQSSSALQARNLSVPHMARMAMRVMVIAVVGSLVSGCAMTTLGGLFGGGSKEQVTGSIDSTIIPQERSLAMAADDMVPSGNVGAAGDCPRISIWQNSAQLTIYEIGRVGDNLAIKHRGEITKTARECEIAPGQVTVKYGVAGRVLLGPLGKSGSFKLPVLVHVTDRSRQKIQTSKADVIVTVHEGKLHGNFSTVQSISFPIEPGIPASQYGVFVTFDHTAPGAG